MVVAIPNYRFRYERKGKPVFVPTTTGRRIGLELKEKVEAQYTFPPTYFHLQRGGHVAAMHHHRDHGFFSRIDISRFFYSVPRRRVKSALDRIDVEKVDFYSKWSTVANPYRDPLYSLPYGFVQSPILASLVLATSSVGEHLASLPGTVGVSVYMDDIALSADSEVELRDAFDATIAVLLADGFQVNAEKLRPPAVAIDIFNCDLTNGAAKVQTARIEAFLADAPSQPALEAFATYMTSVEAGNRV